MDPLSGDPDEVDDATLMRRHIAGDPQAFNLLVTRHRDRLWSVALRTLGNREDAADAVQDALVSAYRRADSFRGDAAVTTWLHRIVVNSCLDLIRRRRVRPTQPLPEQDDRDTILAEPTACDPAELRLTRLDVLSALRMLPQEQRAALVLVDMEGYSVQETAQILDCAPGTVKSRCSRGRAKLVPLLSHLAGNQSGAADVPSESPIHPTSAPGGEPRD